MRRTLSVLILSISALGLIGCGDDDDGGGGSAALTKDEFIERGDAICGELQVASEAIDPPADEAAFGEFLRSQLEVAEVARADFAALDPPEDGEDVHEALLAALEDGMSKLEGAAEAAESGDTVTAGDLLSEMVEAGEAADAEADAYGFEECGSGDDD